VEDVLRLDPNQLHHNYWRDLYPESDLSSYQFHRINLLPDQFWVKTLKLNPEIQPLVYSNHHQALGDIGMNMVVGATSLDGKVVESIHHVKYPHVLGVQFHPENYLLYDSSESSYKQLPEDESFRSAYDVLNTDESLDFHYSFWKYFSELFNEI
jgi:putative glutamine amidotransferase